MLENLLIMLADLPVRCPLFQYALVPSSNKLVVFQLAHLVPLTLPN